MLNFEVPPMRWSLSFTMKKWNELRFYPKKDFKIYTEELKIQQQ